MSCLSWPERIKDKIRFKEGNHPKQGHNGKEKSLSLRCIIISECIQPWDFLHGLK